MIDLFRDEFNKNPKMWTFIVTSLLALFYAALKIKNEPNDYLKNSNFITFQGFELRTPSWWTKTVEEDNLIRFERTDTSYDWYAEYWSINNPKKDITSLLRDLKTDLKIVFDEPNNLESFKIDEIRVARMEGMSTINGIERAYFDMFVSEYQGKVLIGKSHSSILNGCVEGPYFEEVLQRLKIQA